MRIFFNYQSKLKTTRHYFVVLWFFSLAIIFLIAGNSWASLADDLKESLRQQINELQQQIDSYRATVNDLQQQSKSLKREIAILDSKIKSVGLEIKRTDLSIKQTESEIADKNVALGQAEIKIERERQMLSKYLQIIYEADQQGFLEIVLSNDKLSDVFDKVNSLQDIQEGIHESMAAIRQMKINLENEQQVLEDRREELNQLKVLQEIQRRTVAFQQDEKKNLLAQTKGQESSYQALLKKTKADAESIRKNLYLLEGVGLSMPLEQAYRYAKQASDLTGVRQAFLLAVLKKE